MPKPHVIKWTLTLALFLFAGSPGVASAQLPWKGGEHAEIKRLRPADVYLVNQTLMVQVSAVDSHASHITERLKKLITNGVLGNGKNLREVTSGPSVYVECSVTRYEYGEKTTEKKLLMLKDKGTYKAINFTLEVSYKVTRPRDNFVYSAENLTLPYIKEFQIGVESPPDKTQIEDGLLNQVVRAVLAKLTNTEEKLKVRLMGKDDLGRFSRLAQGGQWSQYIESINSLPPKQVDKDGRSEFEGDRQYDLTLAYEALAYENMWKDQERAEKYFYLADVAIRKAQQFDPREKEYVNAQTRLLQGKRYFDTIKERFPSVTASAPPVSTPTTPAAGTPAVTDAHTGPRTLAPTTPEPKPATAPDERKIAPGAMTNKDVIKMLRAGMSEELVIERIQATSEKQFDTTPNGLVELTTGGVSERLIRIIIRAASPPPRAKPPRRRKG